MKPTSLYLPFLAIFFINITIAFAQTATIRGFIYDKSNGEPIPYCSVLLVNEKTGVVSDDNGYFSLTKLKAGEYKIRITFMGYDSLVRIYNLKNGQTITEKLYLEPISIQIGEVQIIAQKEAQKTETRVAVERVSPKQISQLPSIGGIPDIAQYLQILPGVVFTGDQGGQLYIRGGTPIQNKVLLDGLVVYNPFHSIGLFSVFDTDIIKNVDVYSAGFGAEYGNRISSIMDIKTRDGNKKRLSGKFDINTFGAKMVLEGPLMKEKNKNSLTFLMSVKGSYLEQTSKLLYRYADTNGLPYNYLDGYGKISLQTNNGSRINFFGFSFNDGVNYPNIASYKWNSWGIGSSFLIIPSVANMLMDGTLAYSDYKIGLSEATNPLRTSHINGYSFSMNFTYLFGQNSLKYGVEFLGSWLDYAFTNPYGTDCGQESFNSEFAIFVKYKWIIKKIIFEPSLRLHYYASQSALSPEPRIAMKYNVSKNVRLKLAAGLYTQNIMSATSDQDVVNLFYGFLTVPEYLPEKINGVPVRNSLQKGQHIVVGGEFDVLKYFAINTEVYFKNFSHLTNINRYQMFASDNEFILETGKAYGADISIKYNYKKLYVNFVYALNWVNRDDGTIVYRTHFDRRHNINITTSYAFGKNDVWQIDARWNFGTGFPFTKTKGFYPKNEAFSDISQDINSFNESLGIIYDTINRGQLPDYHRLDINFKRKFILNPRSTIELNAGVTNVYNYYNIFYVNRKTNEKIYQLPILWSFSCNINF
ncbi:MAG: TonB-dependent receptor [Bacteroidales bacterium]|jgi:hypothetical protein|nr:TonB-dependent receptor [Bacteroidales bacterium]